MVKYKTRHAHEGPSSNRRQTRNILGVHARASHTRFKSKSTFLTAERLAAKFKKDSDQSLENSNIFNVVSEVLADARMAGQTLKCNKKSFEGYLSIFKTFEGISILISNCITLRICQEYQ